ncbi:MAG: zinc-dependent metalloprotease [Acidimicrobiales bacterium]
MTEPISWEWAERTAVAVAGREPLARSYHAASLQPDFDRLTAEAEVMVTAATGLPSLAGPARAVVTDRAGWVRANLSSFRRLLGPLVDKLAPRVASSVIGTGSRVAAGIQLGVLLGWMSTRVLGQYDLLLAEDDSPSDQDLVYFVGPNVLALEHRYGFPPGEFRLWLALHEVTHRAQFTGIPWMRGYFVSLVHDTLEGLDPDPRQLLDRLRNVAGEVMSGRNPLAEQGLLGLVASAEVRESLRHVQALMSLLEGHGDVTMDRAGSARIPSAARFSAVLRERRHEARGPAKLFQQLIGLDAKLRQYEEGERFIEMVERAGGEGLLSRAWEAPELLPSLDELREPASWIARVDPGDGSQ